MLTLFSSMGELLLSIPFDKKQSIDLTLYPSGVYFLTINYKKGHFVERVVKLNND